MQRIILHADMDAFFASIEERDRPELRGLPVIVGAVSARGVVAAASYAARQFGVRSAMPGFRARELCPQGIFLPSDIKKYARVSEDVHRVFEEFTPLIEPLALDEAFLDVTGSVHFYESPRALAQALKDRVKAVTGLTVSCGVAPNKLVAKLACSLGKPDGLYCVEPHEVRALLDPLPIRRLFGVGPVTERALVAAGYHTFADLAAADPARLASIAGDRAAELRARARGEDDRPVEADREPKSYGEENTFEQDQRDGEAITQALTSHAHAIARRLRRDSLAGRTITLKVRMARRNGSTAGRVDMSGRLAARGDSSARAAGRIDQHGRAAGREDSSARAAYGGDDSSGRTAARGDSGARAAHGGDGLRGGAHGSAVPDGRGSFSEQPRYPLKTRSQSLRAPTDDAAVIRKVALELWQHSGIREPIRLCGISVSNLSPRATHQLSLFDATERRAAERSQKLGPALDAIRARFGEAAIAVASGAPDKLTPSLRKKRGE